MNRTFTFKVDSTIPQLDAIIEDIMDDFSVARKSRRLHIDTDIHGDNGVVVDAG